MLPASLQQSARPVYLLSSDEPLLVRDWLDQARAALASQDFAEINSYQVEAGFDWEGLLEQGQSLSLFSSRRANIIRFNSARPGQPGARFIIQICENPDPDTVYILVMPKLDSSSKNSAWLKRVDQIGEICELKPVYSNQLAGWITRRAAEKGIVLESQAALALADLTEGNLLATDQELEKMALSSTAGTRIGLDQVTESIARSSRYNQFLLVDACLAGKPGRAFKVLQGLRDEGVLPVQVIYPLQTTLETLLELKHRQRNNRLDRQAWQALRIWSSKQQLYSSALARLSRAQIERLLLGCATLDRLNKGQQASAHAGDDWLALHNLIHNFTGLMKQEYPTI